MTRAESALEMRGLVDVETLALADVGTVVVGVKVGLDTDVERLVMVKEIEIEETAQKSFASWIVCVNWSGQRDVTQPTTDVW